jgi:signal transduction histidine kinase
MCLPMLGRDQVLGALCVTRLRGDEPFTRDAIELGMLLGGEAARAIERTKEEEEERNLERSLMRRDKLVTIGELASGVAHEINNPLGYVSSNMTSLKEYLNELLPLLDLLAKAKATDDLPELLAKSSELDLDFILSDLPVCLKETMEGVDRVLKIVTDLKMFARDDIEVKEEANINLVLDGAVNILWNQIKYKAQLVKEYSDIPLVPCYPSQLGQVFLNLLYNASQAIEKRGRIVLRSFQDGEFVIVEVEDNGKGMDPKVLDRIFEPFFTTKPRGVGTGLGLSIARRIIRRHDGTLEVNSTKGRGSLFRLSLPVAGETSNQ